MTNKWNIINKNTITPKIAGILDLTIQIAGKNNKTKSISSAYSGQYHTVKPGQTLYDISYYDIKFSLLVFYFNISIPLASSSIPFFLKESTNSGNCLRLTRFM